MEASHSSHCNTTLLHLTQFIQFLFRRFETLSALHHREVKRTFTFISSGFMIASLKYMRSLKKKKNQ